MALKICPDIEGVLHSTAIVDYKQPRKPTNYTLRISVKMGLLKMILLIIVTIFSRTAPSQIVKTTH